MTKTFDILTIDDIMNMPEEPSERRNLMKALKAYAATNLTVPPMYRDNTPVRCQGEELSSIVWQGRQWAVTSYGIECRDGTYAIENGRFWEDEKEWGWVNQIGNKDWADIQDFAEALRIARGRAK